MDPIRPEPATLSRTKFLSATVAGATALALPAAAQQTPPDRGAPNAMSDAAIRDAEAVVGVAFPPEARAAVAPKVREARKAMDALRVEKFDNALAPAFVFRVEGRQSAEGNRIEVLPRRRKVTLPATPDDLAYTEVTELSELLRTRQIGSVELTKFFLSRLETFGPKLRAVISLTPERAMRTAEAADRLFAKGEIRSRLQGIPTGVKDLFAMLGTRTTWGAEPFREQTIPYDSAVVERLEAAGAPILAKLSLGALAYDDKWFGGQTLNPWNPKQGSSGSSAGSASAVAAGLLPYAIGTETLGSVISPATRCRVVGLRPTFGRVSRYGAMALSWTMDKVGVLSRSPEDAVVVLAALAGKDARDPSAVDRPLGYRGGTNLKGRKIALYAPGQKSDSGGELTAAVQILRGLGATISPAEFTPTPEAATNVLTIEAAAAFDELTRSGAVDTMKGSLWPPEFRAAMYGTGVDYIQAMRRRTTAMRRFEEEFGDADAILSLDPQASLLITTNLTGHPQIYIPLGVDAKGAPQGVSLWGRLYGEGALVEIAQALLTKFALPTARPDLSQLA